EHKEISPVISDGTSFVKIEPLTWNVKSVVPPGQQEPFGPFGPWRMSWPLWWWLVLALIFLVASLISWRKARQLNKQRKLRLEVEEYRKRYSPFDEFQRELRQMQRKLERGGVKVPEMHGALAQGFRLFLMPALDLGERGLRREIWRRHRSTFKKETHQELTKFLTELKRAERPDLSEKDIEQLVDWAQRISETLDSAVTGSAA
ncbi:MAG: hypothetical protein ABL958_08480, partial [Bdellovibrionia bacterium]